MAAALDEILSSHHTRRPVVMGVLNVTPDSFSDGGDFLSPSVAVAQARRMFTDGADIIDIGAESTRPGSGRVSPAQQIARLVDILPAVNATGAIVSIDTTSADVAAFALDSGAAMVNDVSAGRDDPAILALAAERGAALCLMHMLGEPKAMQVDPQYDDVVAEVKAFLAERVDVACAAGVSRERIIIDPGIGFGKKLAHNLALLANVAELCSLGLPVLVGPSRKRFIDDVANVPLPADRVPGTIAACLAAKARGASIFRVHDVAATVQALKVAAAIDHAGAGGMIE